MTQEQALSLLKTGANAFLTGGPGSGKTHTVNAYVAWLRERGIEPAVTASTGIAATHIGGMTIHSWSGIGIRSSLSAWDIDQITSNEPLVRRILKTQVLIIDEISMLDARTFSMVDTVCRAIRQNPAAFGDIQLICVGDFFQLPPVSRVDRGEPRATFAFASPAWAAYRPLVCYLEGQYRQDDGEFLSVLTAIRENQVTTEHLDLLRSRMAAEGEDVDDVVKLFPHNADVDRLNADALTRLPGSPKTYLMRSSGKDGVVASLKRGCLSPEVLHLKLGAAVMFTRNNPQMGYVNGTLGVVEGFEIGSGNPIVRTRGGERVVAEPKEWSVEENGKKRGSVEQVPLRLAWAMTVHKSQGMSLDAAIMDLSNAFEYGQGYVALSRVRRLSGLYLIDFGKKALSVHPDILLKDQDFKEESNQASVWIEGMDGEEKFALEAAFVTRCGGKMKKEPKAGKTAGTKIRKSDRKSAAGPAENVCPEEAPLRSFSSEDVNQKHVNAYEKWTDEEQDRLIVLHGGGAKVRDMAAALGRKTGGIRSRLKKLGLVRQ